MKYPILIILIINLFNFSLVFASAQVPKDNLPVSSNLSEKAQAEQAAGDLLILGLKSAYELENLPDFMNLLDRDFENRLAFQTNLENYFSAYKNLELIMVIDTLLMDQGKLSIRLHWFKKSMTNAGFFAKTEGACQLVFIDRNKKLNLLYIRGDSPFF